MYFPVDGGNYQPKQGPFDQEETQVTITAVSFKWILILNLECDNFRNEILPIQLQ